MLLSTDAETTSPWFKMFFTNSDDQSPVPKVHVVEGENRLLQIFLSFIFRPWHAHEPHTNPSHTLVMEGGREGGREGAEERGAGSFLKTFNAETNVLKIQKNAIEILYA